MLATPEQSAAGVPARRLPTLDAIRAIQAAIRTLSKLAARNCDGANNCGMRAADFGN